MSIDTRLSYFLHNRSWLKSSLFMWVAAIGLLAGCGESGPSSVEKDPKTECEEDSNCDDPSKPFCDLRRGCVECQYDDQCAEGERCDSRSCVQRLDCKSDAECSATEQPVCHPLKSFCVECFDDSQCGEAERCRQDKCEAVETCVNSKDCVEGKVCERDDGICVECATTSDCPDEFSCVQNSCLSDCRSDKDCVAAGLLCDQAAGHCAECVGDVDCPEAYFCLSGSCHENLCRPDSVSCNEATNELETCNPKTGPTSQVCFSGSTCIEKDGEAECVPWTCQPGEGKCGGDGKLEVCDATGFSTLPVNCASRGGVCVGAACAEVICQPYTLSCMNNVSMQCNSSGTALVVSEVCAATEFCSDVGVCEPQVCSPGASRCEGSAIALCNSTGSGYDPAESCPTEGDVCFGNKCLPLICEGYYQCFEGDAYACSENGTHRALIQVCDDTKEFCDDSVAAECTPFLCAASQPTCIGNLAGVCNAQGSGIVDNSFMDCGETDQQCLNGQCKDVICTGSVVCGPDGNLHDCADKGTKVGGLRDTCADYEYCTPDLLFCAADVCAQGQPACDGQVATTCNADGSGFEPGGTECQADQGCVGGECTPCHPGWYYCVSGNSYRCGDDGVDLTLFDTCLLEEFCREGAPDCEPDVCVAGAPVCNQDKLSTCADDGSGPKDAGTSCPAQETCVSGACVPT